MPKPPRRESNGHPPSRQAVITASATTAPHRPVPPADSAHMPDSLCRDCQARERDAERPAGRKEDPPLFPVPPCTPKDVRAYEHDRNRAKRTTEIATLKAIKQGRLGKCRCCQKQRDKFKRRNKPLVGLDAESDVTSEEAEPPAEDLPPYPAPKRDGQVHLVDVFSDLITRATIRQSKAEDFEVVPHIRSVIVLDDGCGDDSDTDEHWEDVGEDLGEKALEFPMLK